MKHKIEKTIIPGSGRRVGEELRQGKTGKQIEKLVEDGGRPAYKMKATWDDFRKYTAENLTLRPADKTLEIWHPEARPSWYWDLVAGAVAKIKDAGPADLDRLRAAYTALFAALKQKHVSLDVKLLPDWQNKLHRLSKDNVVHLCALTDKRNYHASHANQFETIYQKITAEKFVKDLADEKAAAQDTLKKHFDDCVKDPGTARKTYDKYPAVSRNGVVCVRKEVSSVPVDDDLSLVIDKKNDKPAYRHLLAHEFMHAHSADTKGLQEAYETYGEGADEALTEIFGRMVTDILFAKDKGLAATSEKDKEAIAQGVHYNVWPKDVNPADDVRSIFKGGLRYGPEICWLVHAYRDERTPEGQPPTRVDEFPLALLKAYFVPKKKKGNKSKCPIQIPFVCKRIARMRARRRNAA
ncbi:hypothetical protein AB0A77_02915 [Streptomyces varsoviensis]|uniref:hypothetical protein n=1 Tax=Streptomyces varsoviensis TaxID=67373 RepID=UPI0033F9AAB3